MKQSPIACRWAAAIGVSALLAFRPSVALAVPTMDGIRDAEYTLVADSPLDNLLVNAAAVPPINDPADPRAKSLDVKGIWATNSGTDLYLYIELPYLDLNTIAGEWAVVFHLGGANNGIQRTGSPQDPFGVPCDYGHVPACNAVLKSNMAGFLNDFDGNQGYGFLNSVDVAPYTGWTWDTGDFLGNAGWTRDTANNLIRGVGTDGGGVVYKAGKGIEAKIPFAMFAWNTANTPLKPPKPGDTMLMQFYDNVRERPNSPTLYPRGPIDAVPFDAGIRTDPSHGIISIWSSPYTLKVPSTLEVTGARLKDAMDLTHILVNFSDSLGDGAAAASNYAVIDESTHNPVAVASAAIDPQDGTRAVLGLTLPFNTTLKVTVTNVKGASGFPVSPNMNTAEVSVGTRVQFTLRDAYGIMSAIGTNPGTGAPYLVTMRGVAPGRFAGGSEVPMNPVVGQPNTYRSPVVIAEPGVNGYKYRLPEMPDSGSYDDWNALNPNDRQFFVPASPAVIQVTDNAAGPYAGVTYDGGEPVSMTFTLIDRDNLAAGRPVYLTGTFTGWSGDITGAYAMAPVPGKPNTYAVTFDTPPGNGVDITAKYKYILIDAGGTEWNLMDPFGDHWTLIKGAGTPLAQKLTDYVGSTRAARILRVVSGLGPAPGWDGYFSDLNPTLSGKVTLADAAKALKG